MSKDLELWHAVHDVCPEGGCGKCVVLDLEWTDEEWDSIVSGAKFAGEPVDVFVHRCIITYMETLDIPAPYGVD